MVLIFFILVSFHSPMCPGTVFARLYLHYEKTNYIAAYRANVYNLDVIVAAVPILLFKTLADPVRDVM